VEAGFAQQSDVARAFARSVRAIWHDRERAMRPAGWRRSVEQVRTNTCPVFSISTDLHGTGA
jgi:hypothetical protein